MATMAAGWPGDAVVFWSSTVPTWKRKRVPGRLLKYAFTGDHVVQGELMQRREVLKILAAGAALPAFSPSLMAIFRKPRRKSAQPTSFVRSARSKTPWSLP